MLGIHVFREQPDLIRADHDKRGISHEKINQVIDLDKKWLSLQHETNQLRQKKNTAARGIGEAKKSGDNARAEQILNEVSSLGQEISVLEKQSESGDLTIRGPQDPFTAGGVIGLYYNRLMSKLETTEAEKQKWRDRISNEVKLAVKVQENFLPKRN